ncbi:hypothetical protein [Actinophytocola sp.]|uniref:hypothetical protein n=1 Tax=Actinophytocola sp. TaxID=1872138 RepID=UPI003D6C2203
MDETGVLHFAGVVDAVLRHPHPDACAVGLFLAALGFTLGPPRAPANANRDTGLGEGPVVPASKRI